MSHRILLYGPPGAGKGTQAKCLGAHFGTPVLSIRELIRAQIEKQTPLGQYIQPFVERGELPPGNMGTMLLHDTIKAFEDSGKGYVLIGYPRSVQSFALACEFVHPTHIVHLTVTRELARSRSFLRARPDDVEPMWSRRFERYDQDERQVLAGWKKKGATILEIDGAGEEDEVTKRILEKIFL